ncbi:ATP-binding cassette domain-containing protein [Streptomyces sp. NRRL S-340]|uniref:ATP-binding cassette domain-containing protein n=1 Tax=Streptomyces sp. NRRL S-340 TaxID=1463901 RepID=UPI00056344A7|nr:ABC transporter ATP-binding protein [Streptomyces sp. NRRL S-340]
MRFLRARWRVLVRLGGWSVLETGQTFLLGYALARSLDSGFLAGRAAAGLAWLGVAGTGVLLGAVGTGRVYRSVAALVEPLRDRLVERVVARGVREADDGALSRLTQQVEIARDTFAGLVLVSRSFVVAAAGALIGLFSLAPPLALVVVAPLVAAITLFAVTLRPLARRQEAYLAADEALAERLGRVGPGLRDVTAFGAEARVAAGVAQCVEAERRAAGALARWGVLRVAALAVGGHAPVVLLLVAAPWLLDHDVSPGALVGALAYVTQSLLPALQNLIHGLGAGGARLTVVLRRIAPAGDEDLRTGRDTAPAPRPTPPSTPATQAAPPFRAAPAPPPASAADAAPALALSGVTFAYGPHSEPVVRDLDLVVPRGGHLAVVGPSGIGKSTLTALVAGLLEPAAGEIRVCGRPVPGPGAAACRVLIPQEAYVHTGTLGENLTHLRPDPVPPHELLAAAEAVGLAPLLHRLGGPGAPVDPAALSAGERQLIALTRAYLSHAPLALLDEATCHLDPDAEARAERAFAARPGGTLVVVAHRLTSARRADRVLVMDGRDTAYGTHEELLRGCGLYRELFGGWAPPGSQPPLPLRDADGVDPVAGPGLAGDGRHVVAHGSVGQVQAPGDLGDGGALGGQ